MRALPCNAVIAWPPPLELQGPDAGGHPGLGSEPVTRISIFMSVFDVHINRAPVGGTVRRVVYLPGKFLNADLDKASDENERQHVLIERPDGRPIGCTQIAGLVARRIVPFIKPGDIVAAGQRIGLIRFGSRVDVERLRQATPLSTWFFDILFIDGDSLIDAGRPGARQPGPVPAGRC